MTHYICPKCKGALGHKSYASGSTPEWIECEICNGDGYITDTSELTKRIAVLEKALYYACEHIECDHVNDYIRIHGIKQAPPPSVETIEIRRNNYIKQAQEEANGKD